MEKKKKLKTKSLIIEVEEQIINQVKNTLYTKKMCGAFYGAEDEFVGIIIEAFEKSMKNILITRKEEIHKIQKKKKKNNG